MARVAWSGRGLHVVEHLPALFAPGDQPGLFEHDQMFGDRLAGERCRPASWH